ncbi:MAG: cytochrome c biogenesis protein [Saprospiraceae bacterium]
MILKHWWKILSVLVLLYTFTVGMLVPLNSGIESVSPFKAKTGEVLELMVEGYNAHYLETKTGITAWLKLDSVYVLPAKNISVVSNTKLKATFDIPEFLPSEKKVQDATLIVNNEVDGSSLLPSAVFITQGAINETAGKNLAKKAESMQLYQRKGMTFPYRNLLAETIRNTYFHVPLWFGMMIILLISMIYGIRFLLTKETDYDLKSVAYTRVGLLFGILGIFTGALWAKYTWGAYWSWDVKQNMSAVALLIYMAYFVLRSSLDDQEQKARISAIYNIFAFLSLIPLLFIIPRLTDSLHPGNGGNPGLGKDDIDNTMRMVFYPAIIAWTLFGAWMALISYRIDRLSLWFFDDYLEEN